MSIDVSIIIVNYKEPGFLRQCLRGIELAAPRLQYEVIVVDNDSRDESIRTVRDRFPDVHLIVQPKNRGLAVANNVGLRVAHGRYVLLLNPDIALFKGALEVMVDYLDRHHDVGVIGPKLLNPDGTVQLSCYRFQSPIVPILRRTPLGLLPRARPMLRSYLMLDWDHADTRPVDWVLGACMMVRRSAVDRIGLMDERYFMYFEDVDWCRRFWNAGWKVVYLAPTSIVHYHRRMSAESPGLNGVFQKLTRIHIQSGIKYFLKYRRQRLPLTSAHATTQS